LRPYVNNGDVDQALEEVILDILVAIQEENKVQKTLEVFQWLGHGQYWDKGVRDFPVPVSIHYVPGNHDRLVNATPRLRREARLALGMSDSDRPLPHALTFPREGALIRHGHEYDRYNFVADYSKAQVIPLQIPSEAYDGPPFGDFVTVDIASRLPLMYRQHHGDSKILADRTLRTVYQRLLEFDDLRPQTAMLNFLLSIPDSRMNQIKVWQTIEPVIYNLLEELHDHPFLIAWLEQMDTKWQLDAIDVIQTTLVLKSWRIAGIPLGLAQFISNTMISNWKDFPTSESLAAREQVILSGEYRFVVAGHTHRPITELVASDERSERYYINTGTWRNRLPATIDFNEFGRLKALSYVIIYGPDEDLAEPQNQAKLASVDFWAGITQRWLVDD
jgi:UDP-2,3-diacylglucosamine pyrophosphatase LpxH